MWAAFWAFMFEFGDSNRSSLPKSLIGITVSAAFSGVVPLWDESYCMALWLKSIGGSFGFVKMILLIGWLTSLFSLVPNLPSP